MLCLDSWFQGDRPAIANGNEGGAGRGSRDAKADPEMLHKMWEESHPTITLEYPIKQWKDNMELAVVRIIIIYCA